MTEHADIEDMDVAPAPAQPVDHAATAQMVLARATEQVAAELRDLRNERARLNARIKVLVDQEAMLASAIRPFSRKSTPAPVKAGRTRKPPHTPAVQALPAEPDATLL